MTEWVTGTVAMTSLPGNLASERRLPWNNLTICHGKGGRTSVAWLDVPTSKNNLSSHSRGRPPAGEMEERHFFMGIQVGTPYLRTIAGGKQANQRNWRDASPTRLPWVGEEQSGYDFGPCLPCFLATGLNLRQKCARLPIT